jgi:hypothetical protein
VVCGSGMWRVQLQWEFRPGLGSYLGSCRVGRARVREWPLEVPQLSDCCQAERRRWDGERHLITFALNADGLSPDYRRHKLEMMIDLDTWI